MRCCGKENDIFWKGIYSHFETGFRYLNSIPCKNMIIIVNIKYMYI